MQAYLDNSATTRCLDEVKDIVTKTMMEDFGNPSAKHRKGVEAERYVRTAREEIARTLKVGEKEIFFTSGGTESNNWALIGGALANRRAGNHLITTAVEHAAVLQPMEFLKEQGFEVTYLPVDRHGLVSLEALRAAMTPQTILVSMMYVNNEIGTIEPVEEAVRIAREVNPHVLFHVDAIQAYGKLRIYPKKLGIDLLSVSGHKIHGPKGIGFLYVSEKAKIKPLIYGGGQQKGMRSGTDNVPGAAGLGVAAKEAYTDFEDKIAHLRAVKRRFLLGVAQIPETEVQGQSAFELQRLRAQAASDTADASGAAAVSDMTAPDTVWDKRQYDCGAPQIVSVSFRGVRSEVLLHALEDVGVYVSAGSACSSNKKLPVSSVLKEIGMEKELLESTVRFSFSTHTTEEEIDYCLEQLQKILPMLRKYRRH